MSPYLTKSQFIRGLQCYKALWLGRYMPQLCTPPDESLQALFDEGREVGLKAWDLFPGGRAVEHGGVYERLRETERMIKRGVDTIYEAAFSYDDILVLVDILHREGDGWGIYEVKSSTEVKDVHIDDLSVQYHVLRGSGLPLSGAYLVHINKRYVRHGEVDLERLFKIEDLTEAARERQGHVRAEIMEMKAALDSGCPEIDIGPYCDYPYECGFKCRCWSHIPDYSVFNLARLSSERKFDLYYRGIIELKDIPPDILLKKAQMMQLEAELSGRVFIDREGIREFLGGISYPLYFLDFETFNPAIPAFDGTRPYEMIPFQYCLYCIGKECSEPRHFEFLAEAGSDPREEIARRLTSEIRPGSRIITYNMAFEKSVIDRLAREFPSYSDGLMDIHRNVMDLMTPFKRMHYYAKEMRGSYSMKSVLPALVPELRYEGEIKNGSEASSAYDRLRSVEDREEAERIRRALLEYCRLDTFGMVKILERLKEVGS